MTPLCGNTDCCAFLDVPPVPHRDRDTGLVVLLCVECAADVARRPRDKYLPLEPPVEGDA